MNHRKITTSLIIAVMVSLLTFGVQTAVFANQDFYLANNQSVFAAPNDAGVNQQLAQVRWATAKYHDINVAIEEGFTVSGNGSCREDADGADGIAYVNIPRVLQQGVIAEEPELLFYIPSGNGNLRLVAVGYFNRAFYIDTRGIIPGTFTSRLNPLPPYFQEVSGPFTLFNQPPDGPLQVVPGATAWFYGLHVWVWSPNPNGMFATRNPRLNCTANN